MPESRDTQFAGFAENLYKELAQNVANHAAGPSYESIEAFKQEQYRIIAQRAYDLATHIYEHTLGAITRDPELGLRNVPDLTTWPEE